MVEFTNEDLRERLKSVSPENLWLANDICKLLVGRGLSFYQAQAILDYAKALLGKAEI